jgi:hypothetical protein
VRLLMSRYQALRAVDVERMNEPRPSVWLSVLGL